MLGHLPEHMLALSVTLTEVSHGEVQVAMGRWSVGVVVGRIGTERGSHRAIVIISEVEITCLT